MEDEDAVTETLVGAHAGYKSNVYHTGITVANMVFDKRINFTGDPHEYYAFNGITNTLLGADYDVYVQKTQLFGEFAYANHHWATLNGIRMFFTPLISGIAVYRFVHPGYFSVYNNGLTEQSSGNNEEGFLLGTAIRLNYNWQLGGYFDMFSFPWLSYLRDAQVHGKEYSVKVDYQSDQATMYFRYRHQVKPQHAISVEKLNILENKTRQGIKYKIRYPISTVVSMQNEVDYIVSHTESTPVKKGFLWYHQVEYNMLKKPWMLLFRYSRFSVDDYDARVITYENDLTYRFALASFYDRGEKYSFMVRYKKDHVKLEIKYALTKHEDLQAMEHNLRLQCMFTFR
jgi:hypothetical protein